MYAGICSIQYDVGDGDAFLKSVRFIFSFEEDIFLSIEKTSEEKGLQAAYEEVVVHLEALQQSMLPCTGAYGQQVRIGSISTTKPWSKWNLDLRFMIRTSPILLPWHLTILTLCTP